jgi:hypothetical protein
VKTAASVRVGLPYRFDTSYIGTLVFKAAACLEAVLLLGLLVKLLTGELWDAVGIVILLMVVGGFALVIFRKAGGSVGTITASEIAVEPITLYGVSTISPRGRFPITRFKSIRLEWRPRVPSPGEQMSPGMNERVYLSGTEGTPDIEIVRLTDESGRAFARELGELLSLPVEERPEPGVHGSRH